MELNNKISSDMIAEEVKSSIESAEAISACVKSEVNKLFSQSPFIPVEIISERFLRDENGGLVSSRVYDRVYNAARHNISIAESLNNPLKQYKILGDGCSIKETNKLLLEILFEYPTWPYIGATKFWVNSYLISLYMKEDEEFNEKLSNLHNFVNSNREKLTSIKIKLVTGLIEAYNSAYDQELKIMFVNSDGEYHTLEIDLIPVGSSGLESVHRKISDFLIDIGEEEPETITDSSKNEKGEKEANNALKIKGKTRKKLSKLYKVLDQLCEVHTQFEYYSNRELNEIFRNEQKPISIHTIAFKWENGTYALWWYKIIKKLEKLILQNSRIYADILGGKDFDVIMSFFRHLVSSYSLLLENGDLTTDTIVKYLVEKGPSVTPILVIKSNIEDFLKREKE